jgi:hypothetical protein
MENEGHFVSSSSAKTLYYGINKLPNIVNRGAGPELWECVFTKLVITVVRSFYCWVDLPKLFRDSSDTLLRLFRDSSETLPRLFRDSSETLPKLFRDSSETLRDSSETFTRLFRDSSETLPRLFRDSSETLPISLLHRWHFIVSCDVTIVSFSFP